MFQYCFMVVLTISFGIAFVSQLLKMAWAISSTLGQYLVIGLIILLITLGIIYGFAPKLKRFIHHK